MSVMHGQTILRGNAEESKVMLNPHKTHHVWKSIQDYIARLSSLQLFVFNDHSQTVTRIYFFKQWPAVCLSFITRN